LLVGSLLTKANLAAFCFHNVCKIIGEHIDLSCTELLNRVSRFDKCGDDLNASEQQRRDSDDPTLAYPRRLEHCCRKCGWHTSFLALESILIKYHAEIALRIRIPL
jgi:hypothetical protein